MSLDEMVCLRRPCRWFTKRTQVSMRHASINHTDTYVRSMRDPNASITSRRRYIYRRCDVLTLEVECKNILSRCPERCNREMT